MSNQTEEDLSGSKLNIPMPIFHNFNKIKDNWLVKRSHEKLKCFYLVFKPFNSNDDKNFNGMAHIKKYLFNFHNISAMIITREILEKRIHFNVMLWSTHNYLDKHEKKTSKYMMHVQLVKFASDKYKVYEYMIKESKERYMYKGNDLYEYSK